MRKITLLSCLGIGFCLFLNCSNHQTNYIHIEPEKEESKQSLGSGVVMAIPTDYLPRNNGDFRTENKYSSIASVETSYDDFRASRDEYDPKVMKRVNLQLMELSTVIYDGDTSGYLSVVKDNITYSIRYVLAIEHNDVLYTIKARTNAAVKELYDQKIRDAFLSVYIGSAEDNPPKFILTTLNEDGGIIYTRDQLFPTQSKEGSVISIMHMPKVNVNEANRIIRGQVDKLGLSSLLLDIKNEGLGNGYYYYTKIANAEVKLFIALLIEKSGEGILISCNGKGEYDLDDFSEFVNDNFFEAQVIF
ncbi:MAG: hypothetical protein H6561_18755 [Lewinellaceae bacterium]|nr:hypothetical protein [Lewinellaceae bacterium]